MTHTEPGKEDSLWFMSFRVYTLHPKTLDGAWLDPTLISHLDNGLCLIDQLYNVYNNIE